MSSSLRSFASLPVPPRAEDSAHVNVGLPERLAFAAGGAALTVFGAVRGGVVGAALATAGGTLLLRGLSGHCPGYEALGIDTAERDANAWAVEIRQSVTVNRPRDEVYALWRDLSNLPLFMHHVESVVEVDGTHSRWTARIPKGLGTLEWNAEIVEERDGEALAWRSLPDADVDNAGVVRFNDAPGDRGTEVHVEIAYRPPGAQVGGVLASWLDPALSQMVKEDVRRFKHIAEAGEIPTVEGQPSGRG